MYDSHTGIHDVRDAGFAQYLLGLIVLKARLRPEDVLLTVPLG
jgi:hypothetical protein